VQAVARALPRRTFPVCDDDYRVQASHCCGERMKAQSSHFAPRIVRSADDSDDGPRKITSKLNFANFGATSVSQRL
jgi:hypothetical protein